MPRSDHGPADAPNALDVGRPSANPDHFTLDGRRTWLHLGAIAISLALLGLSRLIFNVVGQHLFGLVLVGKANILLSLAMLVGLPASTGLATAISRFVPIFDDPAAIARALRASVLLALVTSVAVLVPAAAVSRSWRDAGSWQTDFSIAAAWAILYAVYSVGRAFFFAKTRIGLILILEIAGFAAFSGGILCTVRWPGLWWLPFAVYPLPMCMSIVLIVFRQPVIGSLFTTREFFRFAMLALLGSVAGQGVQYGSTLVGGATGGASLAGTWATLVSLASPVLLLPRSLSTSFLPRLSGLSVRSTHEFESASELHHSLSALLALPATMLLLIAGFVGPASIFPSQPGVDTHIPWLLLCCLTYVASRSEPILTGNASAGFAGPNAIAAAVAAVICMLSWALLPGKTGALVSIATGMLIYAILVPLLALSIVRWISPKFRPRIRTQPGDFAMFAILTMLLLWPTTQWVEWVSVGIGAVGLAAQYRSYRVRRFVGGLAQ